MAKRGRKTAGELEKVEVIPERPKPPASLNKRQSEIWNEVTKGLPVDWFNSTTFSLLMDYCIMQNRFERESEYIDKNFESMDKTEYCRLAKQCEANARAVVSLATRMRLTQQSTYHPDKSKDIGAGKAPWKTPNLK